MRRVEKLVQLTNKVSHFLMCREALVPLDPRDLRELQDRRSAILLISVSKLMSISVICVLRAMTLFERYVLVIPIVPRQGCHLLTLSLQDLLLASYFARVVRHLSKTEFDEKLQRSTPPKIHR